MLSILVYILRHGYMGSQNHIRISTRSLECCCPQLSFVVVCSGLRPDHRVGDGIKRVCSSSVRLLLSVSTFLAAAEGCCILTRLDEAVPLHRTVWGGMSFSGSCVLIVFLTVLPDGEIAIRRCDRRYDSGRGHYTSEREMIWMPP